MTSQALLQTLQNYPLADVTFIGHDMMNITVHVNCTCNLLCDTITLPHEIKYNISRDLSYDNEGCIDFFIFFIFFLY